MKKRSIKIYGNGKQVRDILFIDDLLDAYEAIIENIDITKGNIYNIGGGADKTISIWTEFGPLLEELFEEPIPVSMEEWRPGDQPVYISDIRKAKEEFGWEPQISAKEGITRLFHWIKSNQALFEHL